MDKYIETFKMYDRMIHSIADQSPYTRETRINVINLFLRELNGVVNVAMNDIDISGDDYTEIILIRDDVKARAELANARLELNSATDR